MAVLLAELTAFVLLVDRFGLGPILLLTLASSSFGLVLLRRSGHSALASLRRLSEGGLAPQGAFVDGMLGAGGALLLLAPGFITDLIGLFLIAPSGRHWLAKRFGRLARGPGRADRPKTGPHTIDLGEGDWTRIERQRSR